MASVPARMFARVLARGVPRHAGASLLAVGPALQLSGLAPEPVRGRPDASGAAEGTATIDCRADRVAAIPALGSATIVAAVHHHPRFSRSFSAAAGETQAERAQALKRLVYRSKQRGVLELDLLVGKWAERNAGQLAEDDLRDLSTLLDEESPDLLQWLLGQAAPPEAIKGNKVFAAIRSEVAGQLEKHSQPATQAKPGLEWVKGWNDIGSKKAVGHPPTGNQ